VADMVSLQGQVKKYKAKNLTLCCPRCPLYLRDSLPWQVAPSVDAWLMWPRTSLQWGVVEKFCDFKTFVSPFA